MSRYRFALRPKWIFSHLFAVVLIVTMVNLGFWQLGRLHDKQSRNARVTAQSRSPVVDVGRVLTGRSSFFDASRVEFRTVAVKGRYRADQELLVRSRSLEGVPGSWVMTPLQLGDGSAVVVNRGWIANSGRFDAVPPAFRAPPGTVDVVGLVRLTETRGSFGPKDPPTGRLANLARADIARFRTQVDEPLLPAWLQLESQVPTFANAPRPIAIPVLDEGPHMSYAIQWFLFSTIALVGYPLILRRRARELARGDDALDRPDPADVANPGDPRLDPVPGRPTRRDD